MSSEAQVAFVDSRSVVATDHRAPVLAAAARPYAWVCGGAGTRRAGVRDRGPVLARERLRGLDGEPCHRGSGVILMTVTEGNSRVCTGGVWQR